MDTVLWLGGLGFSAFTSATVLPGTSEAAFVAALVYRPDLWAVLLAVATFGNTLGGVVSYAMGRWLPEKTLPEGKSLHLLRRYGVWLLLLSWVPLIGDALPLAAGWLRLPFAAGTAALALGKFGRYCVLLGLWRLAN